jgi:hypothetical protein
MHAWQREARVSGSYQARYDAFVATTGLYPDFCEMSVFVSPAYQEESPMVQVFQSSARAVLYALGLSVPDPDGDCFDQGDVPFAGVLDASDLLGRILCAVAVAPEDAGLPAHQETGRYGAVLLDCGRKPGYLQEKLAQLRSLCQWAEARGQQVQWS